MNAYEEIKAISRNAEFVSIIMPVLNEEKFVGDAINSIEPKKEFINYEILIVDGGSSDKTREVVEALSRLDDRIKLIYNEKRLQSAGVNMAVRLANPKAEAFVRADSHAIYPPDFVEICVQKLSEKNADSVVVTMDTVGKSRFQRVVAATQNSLIGNGASAHRRAGLSGYIDHGHHAAFKRDFFVKIGGYDESIRANEDVDLDMRIGQGGGKIWLETSIPITYFPRDTIVSLVRQYYNYGKGRALTYLKYRYPLKLRQLLPVFSFISIISSILLSIFINNWFLLIPLTYVLVCLSFGMQAAIFKRFLPFVFMGGVAILMHQAWAVGFLGEIAESISGRRRRLQTIASV